MSNFFVDSALRDIYWTDGGNNDHSGISLQFAKMTFDGVDGASFAASQLDPPPELFNPASIIDPTGSRHVENFVIPDNVQVGARYSSIAGLSAGVVVSAGENAQAEFLTISTSFDANSGDIAYSSNGKSRIGFDCRAILLNGPDQVGISISGATDQAFATVGQVLCRFSGSTGLDITSTGNSPRYMQLNEINANGDNCTGINYNTAATGAATFRAGAITYEDDGSATGSGNVGINVQQGTLVGYCAEIIMETSVNVAADGDLITDVLLSQGDVINNGLINYRSARHDGDVNNNATGVYRIDYLNGNLSNDGLCLINSVVMTGDIINTGLLQPTIDTHFGSITNIGGISGRINGVEYGFWESENELTQTFLRDGNIPTTYETMGVLSIDTTNDTIASVVGSYTQTTANPRTVNFRLINADNGDVYYTGTSATASISERHYATLTATGTPLPINQQVNLLFQNQRSGPGGINGGGGQIDWTRTP